MFALTAIVFAAVLSAETPGGANGVRSEAADGWRMFDRRVGMFVHWGIYSVGGYHEQERMRLNVPRAEYAKYAEGFTAEKFDANRFVDAAESLGAEYIVLTAKHHDGFCLWDTKTTPFNVMNTPAKRDIVAELSAACRRRGMRFGLYYSNPDWNHPNAYNPRSSHQVPPEPGDRPDMAAYREFVKAQITELLTKYGEICCLFWDIPTHVPAPEMNELVRRLQPNIQIDDRGWGPGGDYSTPERGIPDGAAFVRPTEACDSVGARSWGFRLNEDYRTLGYVTRSIDHILTMGGNFLLNVGPKPDGTIPDEALDLLKRTGDWYRRVCESYRGVTTEPWLVSRDGVMATRRGETVYIHCPKGLDSTGLDLMPIAERPAKVTLLNTGASVAWDMGILPGHYEVKRDFLHLKGLPADALANESAVIRLDFASAPEAVLPGTEDEGLFPFTFGTIERGSVADFSDGTVAPAGSQGFVRTVGEKFYAGDREIFLNGVNLTGPGNFPTHEDAERTAERLARLGVNCVRLHYADSTGMSNIRGTTRVGLLDPNGKTGLEFVAENLDRYDYLVYALQKRGIYVDINLRVGLTLDHRLGFPKGPSLNRGVCAIDPRLQEFEKTYAKQLLHHVNPYTRRRYADDPGVAIVEIRNESGMPGHWLGGLLDDLEEPWKSIFRRRWNDWRAANAGATDEIDLLRGKKDSCGPAYPESVTNQFVRFIFELDETYWRTMAKYVKEDLGYRGIVIASRINDGTPFMHLRDTGLDAVDQHFYWNHPDRTERTNGWMCAHQPVSAYPEDGAIKACDRIAGKPFTLTETSEPFPSLWAAEHFPIVHAYGAFQGWAGIFAYTWNHLPSADQNCAEYFFQHAGRTDTQAHLPFCAAIWRWKGVKGAKTRLTCPANEDAYFEGFARRRRSILMANETLPKGWMEWNEGLRHALAVDLSGKAPRPPRCEPQPADRIWKSDTGELTWNSSEKGGEYVSLDAPSLKFFAGRCKDGQTVAFGDASVEFGKTRLGFATVTMCARDGRTFGDASAKRILIAATGLVKNSGERIRIVEGLPGAWHGDGDWIACRGEDWGHGPQLCEGLPATLTLRIAPKRVRCWALDGCGRRREEVPVVAADGGARLAFGPDYRTVWYEIAVASL